MKRVWVYQLIHAVYKKSLTLGNIPAPKWLWLPMAYLRESVLFIFWRLRSILWSTPIFKARCTKCGKNLQIGNFIPFIFGFGDLTLGNNVELVKVGFFFAANFEDKPSIRIGDNTHIGYNTSIVCSKSIEIGSNCLISVDVSIADSDDHPNDPEKRKNRERPDSKMAKPVVIEDNVWICQKAIILKGVSIGENSIVGAGAVVAKSVPSNVIVVGNPAKIVKSL